MIGIDFDNTIICYDSIFNKVAIEKKLIPVDLPSGKNYVRDYLRGVEKEEDWIVLQGYVYGARLLDNSPFEGVKDFFLYCKQNAIDFCIVSHKTLYPYKGYPYDLHKAAYQWIERQNIECAIYFELTKEEKVKRIANLGCTHFIDDLPEFLNLTGFSTSLSKILFDPQRHHAGINNDNLKVVSSWKVMLDMLQHGLL